MQVIIKYKYNNSANYKVILSIYLYFRVCNIQPCFFFETCYKLTLTIHYFISIYMKEILIPPVDYFSNNTAMSNHIGYCVIMTHFFWLHWYIAYKAICARLSTIMTKEMPTIYESCRRYWFKSTVQKNIETACKYKTVHTEVSIVCRTVCQILL